jgi:hypothetical protein
MRPLLAVSLITVLAAGCVTPEPPPSQPQTRRLLAGHYLLMGITDDDRAIAWQATEKQVLLVPLDGSAIETLTLNGKAHPLEAHGLVTFTDAGSLKARDQRGAVTTLTSASDPLEVQQVIAARDHSLIAVLYRTGDDAQVLVFDAAGKHGPFAFGSMSAQPRLWSLARGIGGSLDAAPARRSVSVDAQGLHELAPGAIMVDQSGEHLVYDTGTEARFRELATGRERIVPPRQWAGFTASGGLVFLAADPSPPQRLFRIPADAGEPVQIGAAVYSNGWIGSRDQLGAFQATWGEPTIVLLNFGAGEAGVIAGTPAPVPGFRHQAVPFSDDASVVFALRGETSWAESKALRLRRLPSAEVTEIAGDVVQVLPAGGARLLYLQRSGDLWALDQAAPRQLASAVERDAFGVDSKRTIAVFTRGGADDQRGLWTVPLH